MAKSNDNVVTHGLSGKIGDLLLFRQRFGKTVVGKIPIPTGEPTEAQLAAKEKFRKGSMYATAVIHNSSKKAVYDARAFEDVKAYNLALKDYIMAPVIELVDHQAYNGSIGSQVKVKATDDFKVNAVEVTILANDGSILEQGNANPGEDQSTWIYAATVLNNSLQGTRIQVKASDLPGNETRMEVTIP